jgi:hypothetical protein
MMVSRHCKIAVLLGFLGAFGELFAAFLLAADLGRVLINRA